MLADELKRITPKSIYSQYGEESYLIHIFDHIGITNKHYVDIGAWDGTQLSNTRLFYENGWRGLMIDGKHENQLVKKHFITAGNIVNLLQKYNTPKEFDLLSIDIDGNDYWVLDQILSHYAPRVIISEYNAQHEGAKTIKYDPGFEFGFDEYYGYTFEAGLKLAERFGYKVVFQNSDLNMYYVKDNLITEKFHVEHPIREWWPKKSNKQWVNV